MWGTDHTIQATRCDDYVYVMHIFWREKEGKREIMEDSYSENREPPTN